VHERLLPKAPRWPARPAVSRRNGARARSPGAAVASPRVGVRAAQRGAEVDQRTGVLESGRRLREHFDRFPKQIASALAFFDQAERAQRDPDSARHSPEACELEFLPCRLARLVRAAEPVQGDRSL
jgi:hypothetical protein